MYLKIMTFKKGQDFDHVASVDHKTVFIEYVVIGNKYCGSQVVCESFI